jgi:hypothetical protein
MMVAEVRTFKDLRRPDEQLIGFYIENNQIKAISIEDTKRISSMIYLNFSVEDEAYMAFSEKKELEKKVVLAKAEIEGREVEYKLIIEDLNALVLLGEIIINTKNSLNELYFEEKIADYLGLKEGQFIRLMPSPVWKI